MLSKKNSDLEILRHSASHVLAAAVLEMFPEAKFGIGPAIENGFYYDFDLPRTLIPEDLEILEEKMKKIIKANYPFERQEITAENAIKHFKKAGQPYKVELLNDISANITVCSDRSILSKEKKSVMVTIYKTGGFVDLCTGPHLDSTGEINPDAIKLTKISGAYWKGDEKNKQLQRIYGVVFQTKKELNDYLKNMEEAEKRDHKKLGKDLDLYSFHPESPGSAFWHPKGMIIWNELEQLGKNIRKKYGYEEIQTPILAKRKLWEISGHWEHYKESMFHFEVDSNKYVIKPMDCPFNIKIYQEKQRSYKELPIRYTEIGHVMRNEKSGELNGLLRVRQITQDDSHIFLSKNQVKEEIRILLKMTREYYGCFGIEPKFYLSTRPDDFMGDIRTWNEAEKDLEDALKKERVKYEIKDKEGVFYGPKIDIDIKDALGRSWQLATIQLDFQLPQRFEIEYVDKDGKKKTPVMIHAAIFGAFERFIGIITEHFAGAFPVWLSPVQAVIIPISEKFSRYAEKINSLLLANNIRSQISNQSETLGKRISDAEKQKIPYMLVVGEKEMGSDSVNVRERDNRNQETMKLEKFIEKITKEITEKK
ncbi:MAG: threonine--tRNA ligase [Candidatus Moranbacteria bacterium]|nr:threonine--tRNA ligase [Candidatus Moranbacteria bacterium]